jgi:nucleoside-diphosphate-sugar epimerase
MSKVAMELMGRNWLDRLPLAFTRPFNYTGPGQSESFLIPKIVGHFSRREPEIRLGNLGVTREFNDVRFIADAYVGLLERAIPGEAYNLCTGQGYSLQQVLDLAQRLSGHQLSVNVDPALVRPNELRELIGDSTKLKQIVPGLGKYNLEGTLRWMLGL